MDYQLVALIGMVVATIAIWVRLGFWWWPARQGGGYQRVFSVAAAGLLLFVAGLVGWDVSHSHGWFQGTRWVDGPIWWQVGTGTALLLLAGFWARRLSPRPAPR